MILYNVIHAISGGDWGTGGLGDMPPLLAKAKFLIRPNIRVGVRNLWQDFEMGVETKLRHNLWLGTHNSLMAGTAPDILSYRL